MKKNNYLILVFLTAILVMIASFACVPTTTDNTETTTTTTPALDKTIAYKCVGSDATYYVFINSDNTARTFNVTDGLTGAVCVVDSVTAGTDAIANPVGVTLSDDKKTVTLEPLTSAIYKK